jgi:hypothetical protein
VINLNGKRCPKCKRKGLHFEDHPHAYGYKDYSRIVCRFCGARFKERATEDSGTVDNSTQQTNGGAKPT